MKKFILKEIVKLLLRIHTISYKLVGYLSSKIDDAGIHPKHRLMNYHKFFVDNIDENDVVLDIGCGNGALSYDVAKKAKKVVGIDLNGKNIDFTTILEQDEKHAYIQCVDLGEPYTEGGTVIFKCYRTEEENSKV